jgi:hypothetical protein
MVWFPDRTQGEACMEAIRVLRKDVLHLKDTFEFHFTSCTHEQRVAFFNTVIEFDFRFGARTIVKENLAGKKGWDKKLFFFQRALDLMLADVLRPNLVEAKLLMDGCEDKKFNKQLEVYVRRKVGFTEGKQRRLEDVKCVDSRKHDLIQMADMVCGAVARIYREDRKEPAGYLEMIDKKCLTLDLWGPRAK